MTDRDLVFKKLAAVETHVRELRTHATWTGCARTSAKSAS